MSKRKLNEERMNVQEDQGPNLLDPPPGKEKEYAAKSAAAAKKLDAKMPKWMQKQSKGKTKAKKAATKSSDTGIDLRAVTHFVRTLRVDDVDCWPTRIDGMEMTFRRSEPTPLGSAM